MLRVKETIEKLKVENLALHAKLIVKETAHARALLDSVL